MMRRASTFRGILLAMLLGTPVPGRADDALLVTVADTTAARPAGIDGSAPSSAAFAVESGSGDEDDSPREGTPIDDAEGRERHTGRATPRRQESNGPRRVAAPRGASLARVERLGLGTRDAALVLLHGTPDGTWIAASGRTPPRVFRWPVDEGAFGRGVGYVRHDRPHVPHNGVDIVAPRGSVVHAAADGLVVYSDNGLRGYGNCVLILHADGRSTLYGHLDRATVPAGYRVRRGERIGFVGSTGHSQGPHLHFELRRDGRPLDPMGEFRGKPWVEARALLTERRKAPNGGHSRAHLGEITPDYAAEPEAAGATRARGATAREDATATRTNEPAATPSIRAPYVPRLHLANAPHAPRVELSAATLRLARRDARVR